MKEHPIIFSAPMVRAIIDGRKTQTRRILKPQPPETGSNGGQIMWVRPTTLVSPGWDANYFGDNPRYVGQCPYGKPGDRLWVRETFCLESCQEAGYYPPPFQDGRPIKHHDTDEDGIWWQQPHYRATDPTPELDIGKEDPGVIWRPAIHMPRWASRITLEITDVRVQRLQDISEEDAKAEGAEGFSLSQSEIDLIEISDDPPHLKELARLLGPGMMPARAEFQMLWDSINSKRTSWNSNPWVWAITFRRLQETS